MDVLEAIEGRKSVRAFKQDPVPRELLDQLLELSQRSPSGTNTQPWHVYLCAGDVKTALTEEVLQLAMSNQGESYEEMDYYPDNWKDIHRDRRRGVGWALYGLLGIKKGDREGSMRQMGRNFMFFDAPVGLFITVDSYLKRGSWADAGMYAQTIMLAARGLGLETCPQAAWIPFQNAVMKHLDIPEDQELLTGMCIGYPDNNAIENTLVSEREAVTNVAHFRGF